MFIVGQKIKGTFVKLTYDPPNMPHHPLYGNMSGALFDIGEGQWAKLPVKFAAAQYSEGMTRSRIARLKENEELEFEIIRILPGKTKNDKDRNFITISEQHLLARQLITNPPKLWEVTVTQPEIVILNGVQVQFPYPSLARMNLHWHSLSGDHRKLRQRCASLRKGNRLVVKVGAIDHDPKWWLNMHEVEPKHYPDLEIVRRMPGQELFSVACDLATRNPDRAADFIKEVAI
jgi:hypothetical protein